MNGAMMMMIIISAMMMMMMIITIIIICFYEPQYTYCNMKLSTLLAILIHNMTHNMLQECFCKFITSNFT